MIGNTPLYELLKALKNEKRMSAHQISEISGVPESTVSRILSGETDRPSFVVVSQIVKAMGGSLDVLAGIKEHHNVFEEEHLRRQLADAQKELLKTEKQLLDTKKWIMRLFIVICVLIVVIAGVFILDHLNGSWGYFRH